jgi:hypothetical protein
MACKMAVSTIVTRDHGHVSPTIASVVGVERRLVF